MKSIARKNILKAAKDRIKQEILVKLSDIQAQIQTEYEKDDFDQDLIEKLELNASNLTQEYNDFKKTKRAKKKASIQWSQDNEGNIAQKPKKPHREVKDWDALHKIRDGHRSTRPRASAWLQEGGMVVQRGSSMPMMVLTIRNDGIVQVLAAGATRNIRDIALRPAFDEE